jgi:uncharacterized protein (UPF0332 family)
MRDYCARISQQTGQRWEYARVDHSFFEAQKPHMWADAAQMQALCAYYAMFYVAEACLLGIGLSFSRHAGVFAAFGERFTKTGIVSVELHRYLIEGQAKRNVGDYQIGPGLTDIQAAEQFARAEQFLHLAQRLLEWLGISKAFFAP